MENESLIERMVAELKPPEQVPIFNLRQYSIEELTRRAKRLIGTVGEMCNSSTDRADWVQQKDRTLVRLPQGGRAVLYHASAAIEVITGLSPMDKLFEKVEGRERLEELVAATAKELRIDEWVAYRDELTFERLWQIKAAAGDKERKIEPVLCRIVGAYRQNVAQLPVLGAASVAIKLAGGGALDSVSVQIREHTGEPSEWAKVIPPEVAARQALANLRGLMGQSKTPYTEYIKPQEMQFGYLNLGKRKSQRVLAPHYIVSFSIHAQEVQAYQLILPATSQTFLPLCLSGSDAPPAMARREKSANLKVRQVYKTN